MEVYKFYPAASDVRSSASSRSVLADTSRLTLPAADTSLATSSAADADSVLSLSRDVSISDSFDNVSTFGDTRRMVLCLSRHVVHGE